MKLLKFIDGDAPQIPVENLVLDNETLSTSNQLYKWKGKLSTSSVVGHYWLADDQNKLICPLNDILVMERTETTDRLPKGVTSEHLQSVDIRSKLSRRLQRSREEYGVAFGKTLVQVSKLNGEKNPSPNNNPIEIKNETVVTNTEQGEDSQKSIKKRRITKDSTAS